MQLLRGKRLEGFLRGEDGGRFTEFQSEFESDMVVLICQSLPGFPFLNCCTKLLCENTFELSPHRTDEDPNDGGSK